MPGIHADPAAPAQVGGGSTPSTTRDSLLSEMSMLGNANSVCATQASATVQNILCMMGDIGFGCLSSPIVLPNFMYCTLSPSFRKSWWSPLLKSNMHHGHPTSPKQCLAGSLAGAPGPSEGVRGAAALALPAPGPVGDHPALLLPDWRATSSHLPQDSSSYHDMAALAVAVTRLTRLASCTSPDQSRCTGRMMRQSWVRNWQHNAPRFGAQMSHGWPSGTGPRVLT